MSDDKITFTRAQIAEIRQCTPQYVTRRKLPKNPDGSYSITENEVFAFIGEKQAKDAVDQYKKAQHNNTGEKLNNVDDEDTRLGSVLKAARIRKLDLEFEMNKKNVIPVELAAVYLGAFSSGIDSNFLNVGKRVAKNDRKLEEKINKEVGNAISKTKDGARKALKKESELIQQAIGSEAD